MVTITSTGKSSPTGMPQHAGAIAGLSVWVEGMPVSVNSAYGIRRPGRTRTGRFIGPRHVTAQAQSWRDLVWLAFRMQRHQCAPEQLPLRIHCIFYAVRGDSENYCKLTLNRLKLALGVDDRYSSPITAEVVRGQGTRNEMWTAGKMDGRAA